MRRLWCYGGQLAVYGALAGLIGYFSQQPRWSPHPPGSALIKISFSHAGEPVRPCRRRSAEELARLPANLRLPLDCPRQRAPVTVVVELDGQQVLRQDLPPTGLHDDGAATLYERLPVPAGAHRITLKLHDSVRSPPFKYRQSFDLQLAPAQVLVIGFDPGRGGFLLQRPAAAAG